MRIKRAVMMGVLVAAIAAIALPVIGLRARAASNSADLKANARLASPPQQQQQAVAEQADAQASPSGSYSAETIKALGLRRLPQGVHSRQVGKLNAARIARANPGAVAQVALPPLVNGAAPIPTPQARKDGGAGPPLAGQPNVLNELGALSAALITTIGGRDTQFSEVALLADWDGREDCVADRSTKVDDFSTIEPDIDFTLTKAAISEVTFANGHLLNLYYYGDSVGNVYFGADLVNDSLVDVVFDVNLPDLVNVGTSNGFVLQNPTAGDCSDDQMTVTGIAVNPVADLGDFGPGFCGIIGEVIYVSAHDSQGCASNALNQPIRTRIFAFATFNIGATVFIVPQVRQILRSQFGNVAGVAVDDDGSLYFHLADLVQLSGAAIFKATETPQDDMRDGGQDQPGDPAHSHAAHARVGGDDGDGFERYGVAADELLGRGDYVRQRGGDSDGAVQRGVRSGLRVVPARGGELRAADAGAVRQRGGARGYAFDGNKLRRLLGGLRRVHEPVAGELPGTVADSRRVRRRAEQRDRQGGGGEQLPRVRAGQRARHKAGGGADVGDRDGGDAEGGHADRLLAALGHSGVAGGDGVRDLGRVAGGDREEPVADADGDIVLRGHVPDGP